MVGRQRDAPMVTKSGYLHKRSFKGHKDVVNAFLSDETRLFTASSDATIKVWALDSGALLTTLEGHQQGVCCLALHADALFSGSLDARVLKWDLFEMRSTRAFRGHSEAVKGIVLRDKWLLSASRDKTVRVWNEASGKCIAILRGHTAPVLCLVGMDRLLYTGSDDCSIRQWDWLSGAQMREYGGHTDGVTDLKVAGENLFSASFDATVRMWDIKSGQCVRICKADAGLRGLEIAAGKVFGAGNNACLYIWDLSATRTEPLTSDRIARGGLTMVTVDGNTVFAASADNIVRVWEKVSSAQQTSAAGITSGAGGGGKSTSERAVSFPPGARKYIGGLVEDSASESEGEGEEGAEVKQRKGAESGGPFNVFEGMHTDKVHGVCAAEGMLLCCSSDNSISRIPLTQDGEAAGTGEITRFQGHEDRVLDIVTVADGEVLFSGSADGTVKKWDVASGKCIGTLTGHTDWVSCLCTSDGALFSGSWDGTVRKWDLSTDRFITQLSGHQDPVHCLCASPGVVMSGSRDCAIRAWRSESGECIKIYEGHTAVVSALVIQDPVLYSASWDRTIRIWDLQTGRRLRVLPQQPQPVLCLALMKGVLFAGGSDCKVRALDPGSGKELACLEGHSQAVNKLSLLGGRLFSASDDGTVAEWRPTRVAPLATQPPPVSQDSAPLADRIAGGPSLSVVRAAAGSLATQLTTEAQFLTQAELEDPELAAVQGFLLKQGSVFRRWSRRYYTLDRGVLAYFADEKRRRALDHVVMKDVVAVARDADGSLGVELGFTVTTADREYRLAAPSEQELASWIQAFTVYVDAAELRGKIALKKMLRKY
ncbi:hypothetical protein T484DRAFT_1915240 [Baffinella frigidus]|nr:hypothetical protein T484DRAFT_1915240 [Cryptophyta sp. CCMP2293]